MGRASKWELFKYERSFRHRLPYIPKVKKRFVVSVRGSLKSYLAEHPSATMDEIRAEFGTVEQLCEAYTEQMTQEQLMEGVRLVGRVRKYLLLLVVVLFLLDFFLMLYYSLTAPPDVHYPLVDWILGSAAHLTGGTSA